MKYRDLILVLVLVAVGVLWWSGPQTAASENPEGSTQAVAIEATPAAQDDEDRPEGWPSPGDPP